MLRRSQSLVTVPDRAQRNRSVPSELWQVRSSTRCRVSVGGRGGSLVPFLKVLQKVFYSAWLLCRAALSFRGCEKPSVGLVNWCGLSELTKMWFKKSFCRFINLWCKDRLECSDSRDRSLSYGGSWLIIYRIQSEEGCLITEEGWGLLGACVAHAEGETLGQGTRYLHSLPCSTDNTNRGLGREELCPRPFLW